MIKCKDCKYFNRHYFENRPDIGHCFALDDAQLLETLSCAEATRRDGLTECCATCKHKWPDSAGPYCHQGNWHHNVREDFRYDKMKCDEWEAK